MRSLLRTSLLAFLFFLLVANFASSVSAARSIDSSRATGLVTAKSVIPTPEIIPLPIHSSDSLSQISQTKRAADEVVKEEKSKYVTIQEKLIQTPSAEKDLVTSQLAQQRRRVLVSMLNQLIVVYHKLDYMTTTLDTSLVRLRVLYNDRKHGQGILDFDARVEKLNARLVDLKIQSQGVGASLAKVQSSIDLAQGIQSSKKEVSTYLQNLRGFIADYQSLVQDVLSN